MSKGLGAEAGVWGGVEPRGTGWTFFPSLVCSFVCTDRRKLPPLFYRTWSPSGPLPKRRRITIEQELREEEEMRAEEEMIEEEKEVMREEEEIRKEEKREEEIERCRRRGAEMPISLTCLLCLNAIFMLIAKDETFLSCFFLKEG